MFAYFSVITVWLRRHWPVVTAAAAWGVLFSILSILRHVTFHTQTWDLGVFEQSFWNTLQGRPMYNLFEGANHLSVHFSPFLFLLVPFYALSPGPYPLLILQSLALWSGAIPLYLLTCRWMNRRMAWLVVFVYLLYPPMHWLNLFDFHEVPFAVPAFLWAFERLDRGRRVGSAIALAFAASTAENMILATAGVGLYLLVATRQHRRFGAAVLVASLLYFMVVAQFIMPALGGKIYRLDRYANLGTTPAAIARTILTDPMHVFRIAAQREKLRYIMRLFAPLAGLPIAAPGTWLLLAPGLAQNLLTDYSPQFENSYQYDAILIPFLFIGLAAGLKKLAPRFPPHVRLLQLALLGTSIGAFIWWSPVGLRGYPWSQFLPDARTEVYAKIRDQLPAGAQVAAVTNLVPHLTHRDGIWIVGTEPIGGADIVVIDTWDSAGFSSPQKFQNYFDRYLQDTGYRRQLIEQRFMVISRSEKTE